MSRSLEYSPLLQPVQGLGFLTVKSQALRGRADVTLFVPPQARDNGDVPLVLLLHGVYGSHWNWAVKGRAHRTAQRLIDTGVIPPMALAMPSDGLWGDGSGYIPHPTQDFERWIVEDVPAAVVAAVPCVSARSPLFIAGLSMGGFGALRIGAKHPRRYRALSAHSAITHLDQMKSVVEEDLKTFGARSGDCGVWEVMSRQLSALPPLRFDCGTEDSLLEHNRQLHRQLCGAGIAHGYEEFPGGHEWTYWETHLADSLRFFASVLRGANTL
jgi:S-formylglutathione hydrolase FrmB